MTKTRSTKCKLKCVEHGSRSTTVTIELKIPKYKGDDVNYEIKELRNNLKWLGPHLASWRGWDSAYSTELFSDGLRELAHRLLKYSNHTQATKHARRALWAANRLKRIGDRMKWHLDDKSSKSLWKSVSHEDVPMADGCVWWKPVYSGSNAMGMDPQEYIGKMSKVINKRINEAYENECKETWAYIGKYIQYWWD